jgi:hypothetical protein
MIFQISGNFTQRGRPCQIGAGADRAFQFTELRPFPPAPGSVPHLEKLESPAELQNTVRTPPLLGPVTARLSRLPMVTSGHSWGFNSGLTQTRLGRCPNFFPKVRKALNLTTGCRRPIINAVTTRKLVPHSLGRPQSHPRRLHPSLANEGRQDHEVANTRQRYARKDWSSGFMTDRANSANSKRPFKGGRT